MPAPFSIIIPTLNSQCELKETLGSLFEGIENNLIKGAPIKRAINNDVKNANPVLNVIYLKTFKKVKVSM